MSTPRLVEDFYERIWNAGNLDATAALLTPAMNVEQRSMSLGAFRYATVFLRFALAAAFLTSIADRFGIWGPLGTANVAWGDMTHFMAYAAKLNPWFPKTVIPAVAWFVTVAETSLGAALILGLQTRRAAQLSGWLLLAFGIGMTAGTGIESALNASVFSASAGAFLLATSPEYPLSIDSLRACFINRCGLTTATYV